MTNVQGLDHIRRHGSLGRSMRGGCGFTLIELLVVMAVLGLLLAIAAPRYVNHVDHARETALRQDLAAMRDAIDKYYSDHGKYPASLTELVTNRYLRQIPPDPLTDRSDTWREVMAPGAAASAVQDVKSGAPGQSKDGSAYAHW